jgi:hypothetical protein
MPRYLNRNVCRRAETIKPQLLSCGNRAHPKAAVANDSRAHQWRHLLIGKLVGDYVNEILWRKRVFRIAAIHCISRELGRIAQIFLAAMTVCAGAISLVQPGNPDTLPHRKAFRLRAEFFDRSDYLVARNQRRFYRRKFTLDHVQVSAANAAYLHAHEHFSRPWFGPVHILKPERICIDPAGRA